MPQISLDWDTVKKHYPLRPLTGELKKFMDKTPGTPCCVQMSHALGIAGCSIPPRSNRRPNSVIIVAGVKRYYLLAVDEMKWFLDTTFGEGEVISTDNDGNARSTQDMMDVLDGRTGILVFIDNHYGKRTELWDETHMHQRDMSPAPFHSPRVLFWDVMLTAVA